VVRGRKKTEEMALLIDPTPLISEPTQTINQP
jgi:hypothetical protein